MKQTRILFYLLLMAALVFQPAWINYAPPSQEEISGPIVSEEVLPFSSPEARSLPVITDGSGAGNVKTLLPFNPYQDEPDQGKRGTWDRQSVPIDPLIETGITQESSSELSPAPLMSILGTSNPAGCGACTPPNSNGDVSPSYYVQAVDHNQVTVYTKSGTVLAGPFSMASLWPSGSPGGCDASYYGGPIVLYDPISNRWLLSQVTTTTYICVAISKTSDPAGAYWAYEYNVGDFPDSFKWGVWPDGYYMSANEHTPRKFTAYAFNRAKMLAGQASTFIKFTGGTNFYMPSDLDGSVRPPSGAPNYFYTFKDGAYHGGVDRIEIREFHADWVNTANSTFVLKKTLNVTPFTYTVCGSFQLNCIHQSGTTQRLDARSEFPMYRFPYRSFGTRQSLVGTFTVGGGKGQVGAAIRWFELRNTGTSAVANWVLYQQGTFDPGDGNDRFIPSIAMDAVGNIALGYSVSSSSMHPAIRYTVHRIGDTLGTMQTERALINGGGSQTGTDTATGTFWGRYSSMTVDPSDNLTFWYTNEYYAGNSDTQWKTRIGKFKIMNSLTLNSAGAYDGWVLESAENGNMGGSIISTATTFRLGDDATRKQYRGILSFSTASLPDTANITSVSLKVKSAGVSGGGNPVTMFQGFMVDVKKGPFGAVGLEKTDFQATANKILGPVTTALSGGWYTINLTGAKAYINKVATNSGVTQIRLRFKLDDNGNSTANFLSLFSGNAAATDRPKLIIQYYIQ